jgi:hypothetical protein
LRPAITGKLYREFSAALNRIYGIQGINVGGTTIQNKHFIETAHELSTHHEDQMAE